MIEVNVNNMNVGDIWYYNNTDEDIQYMGVVTDITDVRPTFAGLRSHDNFEENDPNLYVTVNWEWVRDGQFPDSEGGTGEVTYDCLDLSASEYHSWILQTYCITEKERLTIILSAK